MPANCLDHSLWKTRPQGRVFRQEHVFMFAASFRTACCCQRGGRDAALIFTLSDGKAQTEAGTALWTAFVDAGHEMGGEPFDGAPIHEILDQPKPGTLELLLSCLFLELRGGRLGQR
jgi:hypothetical protein